MQRDKPTGRTTMTSKNATEIQIQADFANLEFKPLA